MSEMSRGERVGARIASFGCALPVLTLICGIVFVIVVAEIIPASATAGVPVLMALILSFPIGFCIALTGGVIMAVARNNRSKTFDTP